MIEIDKGIYQGILTAILFVAFVLLWRNVWRKEHKETFDDAANIPLEDNEE